MRNKKQRQNKEGGGLDGLKSVTSDVSSGEERLLFNDFMVYRVYSTSHQM